MAVIVVAREAQTYRALEDQSPAKHIAEAWIHFITFHLRSQALVRRGQTQDCVGKRGKETIPGVPGELLYPQHKCCGEHASLGELRRETVELLKRRNLYQPVTDAHGTAHDPLTAGWWLAHGHPWQHDTPIVLTEAEVPQD